MLYKYLIISVAALALDVFLLHVLVWIGVHYMLAAPVAFMSGALFVYFCSAGMVFGRRRRWGREFALFVVVGVLGLLINELVMYMMMSVGSTLMIAKIVAAGCSFISNFLCRRHVMMAQIRGEAPSKSPLVGVMSRQERVL